MSRKHSPIPQDLADTIQFIGSRFAGISVTINNNNKKKCNQILLGELLIKVCFKF